MLLDSYELRRTIYKHFRYLSAENFFVHARETKIPERPVCTCGLHLTYSRSRLAMLSDSNRNDLYLRVLRKASGLHALHVFMSLKANQDKPKI